MHNIITYTCQTLFDDGHSIDSVWVRETLRPGTLAVEIGRNRDPDEPLLATGDNYADERLNDYGEPVAVSCNDLARDAGVASVMIHTRPDAVFFEIPGSVEQAEQLIHDTAVMGDALDWQRFGRAGKYRWLTKPEAWNVNKSQGGLLSWRNDQQYSDRLDSLIRINEYRTRGVRGISPGDPCTITGNTYEYRQLLKNAGCKWDPVAKVWYHPDYNKITSAASFCRGLTFTKNTQQDASQSVQNH